MIEISTDDLMYHSIPTQVKTSLYLVDRVLVDELPKDKAIKVRS